MYLTSLIFISIEHDLLANRMKSLISSALFYPSRLGGPANTLYWLAKALVKYDVNTTVVTTDGYIEDGKVTPDTWSDVDGIWVRYCKSGKLCMFKMLWHTWKEIKTCDCVILCDMFQRQVLPVAFTARMQGKKIIWSPRGELFGPALEGSKAKRYYIAIVRRFFGRYAIFHATSDEEREMIYDHIGKDAKVVVIPNYIELPQQQDRENVQPPYFLYVGRINSIKALDCLILGLTQSKLFKRSGYILKLAGPNQDNYQQELEDLINDNGLQGRVEFVGNVFGKEKYQLYANAHFSCLLSHSENFGNVVIEALSQGTPVLASTGTPWQVLNETNAGYWIDNSPESIGTCVDKVLEMTDGQYAEMRQNARSLANCYDVELKINKWVDII